MKIIDYFLNFLLFMFSYMVPKEKGTYLLSSKRGKNFAENPKYLYLYANNIKKNDKFFWITEDLDIKKKLGSLNLPVVKKHSLSGFWKILRSEKLLFSSGARDIAYSSFLLGRFNLIELWHGMPIKSIEFKENKGVLGKMGSYLLRREYSLHEFVLHTNKRTKDLIKQAFPKNKINVLGYPRNDGLFRQENFEKIPDLKKYKKIFFYMPTFRDKKSRLQAFSGKGLVELNGILKNRGQVLLVKKHPDEKNWPTLNKYSNIRDISYIGDPYEVLSKTDVLITDYSSVCFDFSLLDRPIIFYPYDYEEYVSNSRKIMLDYYKEMPGPFAYNERDLIGLIKENNWEKDGKYRLKCVKYKKKYNDYLDANSSKRVYGEI